MSGTVVLYVTRSGHAKVLAEDVAQRSGTKALEIGDLVGRKGILGFIKTGAQAARNLATPIRDPEAALGQASIIVLVQPVWANAVCPPLRTWLQKHKAELAGKRLALLCTNKGSPGEALRAKFETEFGQLASFAVIQETKEAGEKSAMLDSFLARLNKA